VAEADLVRLKSWAGLSFILRLIEHRQAGSEGHRVPQVDGDFHKTSTCECEPIPRTICLYSHPDTLAKPRKDRRIIMQTSRFTALLSLRSRLG
jgi:hypothetical protein